MPLFRKPHTLTLIEASETIDGDSVVESTDHDLTAITVRGQVTPLSSARSFELAGVNINAPHLFMFELSDIDKVVLGNRFRLDGRVFEVSTPPERWDAEPRTAHATCQLTDLTAQGPVEVA